MIKNSDIDSKYQSALQLANSGNYDSAIAELKSCVELDAQFADALLLLARFYLRTSRLDNASDTYSQARTIEKFESEAVAGIARIRRLQGNAGSAYDFIQEQIKSLKPHVIIILAYSEICLELEYYTEAIQKIQDLLNNNIQTI